MTAVHHRPILREVSGPPMGPLAPDAHLLAPVARWAREAPDRPLLSTRSGDRFVPVTAARVEQRVRELAKGLVACGVADGDRVVIMAHTRVEWLLLDYAILAVGGVTVPIYETSSGDQMEWILSDSGAVLAFLETPTMKATFDEVRAAAPGCREALVIDEGALDELAARGGDVDDAAVDARIAGLGPDHLATIVYTSGTTGRPKGCLQTHGNLVANVAQNIEVLRPMLSQDETLLLFLPLAHTLAKIIALVCVEWGSELAFATDLTHLAEELPIARPTLVVAVPRVFEKVYNSAQHKATAEGHGKIFARAEDVAISWSQARTSGRRRPLTDAAHLVFDRLVYRKVKAAFGGRLRFAVSGGGPLGERLTHFFNGVGVRVFEGYGLTETSPTLTVNHAGAWKPGTVGPPLPGTTIRIAEDGEILAKGPQVFQGYWKAEEATADVFDDDGWFRTGDIGELDGEGFLRITGRKKELIVTAAGKNIAPAPLEDQLRAHPLISQAVVVGDQRPFVAALLTVDEEAAREWAALEGLGDLEGPALLNHERLRAALQDAVDAANATVSRAESIRKFTVLPHDLTIESGELTPTLKVRRAVVTRTYSSAIEEIYG